MQLLPWRKVKAWKCLRCGKCCTKLDVMVTPDEERRLEKYGDVFERGRVLVYLKTGKWKVCEISGKTYGMRKISLLL